MTKEEEFNQGLYDEANEQLKEVYKEQKQNRDELLQAIAMIILTYTVLDGLMSLKSKDKSKEYQRLSKLIISFTQNQKNTQAYVINNILGNTVKNSFKYYSYNANLKDVKKIVDDNFKGKHFSGRVWENEKAVGEHLHKQVKQFLNGKVNVNQIKKDIEKTYNTNAYNAKRLTETEVARCSSNAFDRFCIETGVKKVRYNATLCNTCDKCMADHGKIFDFKDKKELPRHPLCHCFYTIEDHKITKYIINKNELNDNADIKKFITKLFGRSSSKNEVILFRDLPKKDIDNIIGIVSRARPELQQLFLRYSEDIRFLDINYKNVAHYNTKYNAILFDLKKDSINLHGKGEYTTFFHELGHLIDRNMGRPSTNFELSTKFKDAIINDVNDFIINIKKSYNIRSEEKLCNFISEQLEEKREQHSISDIFGGVTGNKIVGRFSHPDDYWQKPYSLQREVFAHFFEATIRNDEEKLNMFINILPNAYDVFIKLLGEM